MPSFRPIAASFQATIASPQSRPTVDKRYLVSQVRETHESAGDSEVLDVDVRVAALDGSPDRLEDTVSLCLLDTPGKCWTLLSCATFVQARVADGATLSMGTAYHYRVDCCMSAAQGLMRPGSPVYGM